MQVLIETCDRCHEEFDNLPCEVKVRFGGSTLGVKLAHDLCAECFYDLQKWITTKP